MLRPVRGSRTFQCKRHSSVTEPSNSTRQRSCRASGYTKTSAIRVRPRHAELDRPIDAAASTLPAANHATGAVGPGVVHGNRQLIRMADVEFAGQGNFPIGRMTKVMMHHISVDINPRFHDRPAHLQCDLAGPSTRRAYQRCIDTNRFPSRTGDEASGGLSAAGKRTGEVGLNRASGQRHAGPFAIESIIPTAWHRHFGLECRVGRYDIGPRGRVREGPFAAKVDNRNRLVGRHPRSFQNRAKSGKSRLQNRFFVRIKGTPWKFPCRQ